MFGRAGRLRKERITGLSNTPKGQTPVQKTMHPKKFVTNVAESVTGTDCVLNERSVVSMTAMLTEFRSGVIV